MHACVSIRAHMQGLPSPQYQTTLVISHISAPLLGKLVAFVLMQQAAIVAKKGCMTFLALRTMAAAGAHSCWVAEPRV